MKTPLDTLLHPFEAGLLPLPPDGARGIVFNAQPAMRRPEGFHAELVLVQGFRPLFLPLERSGHDIAPEPRGDGYDLAFVIAGRHRRQNEIWIAKALARTRPGGTIVVGGARTDGIASLRKRLGDLLPLAGSASKYHGIVFWLVRSSDEARIEDTVAALTPQRRLVAERFETAPGGFSADNVDAGSKLLADSIPDDLSGHIADFCAGWGYLTAAILERCPKVAAVDLFEADHVSLEAARHNLATATIPLAFHWQDLAAEPVPRRFDAIVMNPPFHQGRAGDPSIGAAMIRAASAALKPNGRLFMVGNRHLPYEATLAASFRQTVEIVRDKTYKVLSARR